MLNEQRVREQITEVRKALQDLEPQRIALEAIEKSLLDWLDLNGKSGDQLPLTSVKEDGAVKKPAIFKTLGSISLAEAMVRTLRNRAGTPMKVDSILETALSMGAVTKATKPAKNAEWTLYHVMKRGRAPIKKVAPLTWLYEEPSK